METAEQSLGVPLKVLQAICLLLILTTRSGAQGIHDWKTITYMNDITDMLYTAGEIWVTTSGGAYKFNPGDSTSVLYTNVEGLGSLTLTAIEKDEYAHILAGSHDGAINIYDINQDHWSADYNLRGTEIVDLFVNHDTLWVATTKGVAVFFIRTNDLEFRDYYDNLPLIPQNAYRIAVFNDRIYYATENGLLSAPSNFIKYNLKLSETWWLLTTENGLPANSIRDLVPAGDSLFVATSEGVATISMTQQIRQLSSWTYGTVNRILITPQSMYFIRDIDYFYLLDGNWIWLQSENKNIKTGTIGENEELWLGLQDGGIKKRTWLHAHLIDGPASNFIGVLTKDEQGSLWISSGKFKLSHNFGFYKYNFTSWTNYLFSPEWYRKNSTATVFEDLDGKIWIGNWGGGITIVDDQEIDYLHAWTGAGRITISTVQGVEQTELPEVPAEKRPCLPGAAISAENYTVIPYFIEDNAGNLWCVNHLSSDLNYLAVIPRDQSGELSMNCDDWIYFGGNIGINSSESEISSLAFDDFGRLWIGTFTSGILVFDYNGTPANRNDDSQLIRLNMVNANLYSNAVLTLAKDKDGLMWIGTAAGLNSFDGVNFYKHVGDIGPIENKINHIFVDEFNNKWFATDGGMSILQSNKSPWDSQAWIHYSPESSGLPSKIINSIFVDSQKSEAYIGTENGLSIFSGSFAEYKQDLNSVVAGPSPFILNDQNMFTIKNLVYGVHVKILNINGRLVRLLSESNGGIEGGRAVWDGQDDSHKKVPSGIYIYLIYNEEGVAGNGKVAVINP
jgi:ligand-binding sensor domain-containing protein